MGGFSDYTRSQVIAHLKKYPSCEAARISLEMRLREDGDSRGAKIQGLLRGYTPCLPLNVTEAERECIISAVCDFHDRDTDDLVLCFDFDEELAVWTFTVGDRHTGWEDDTYVLLSDRGDLMLRTLRAGRVL